ncbi:hypothetical protein B0T16DRAFT_457985 [Cercophora newfieldiana]|uniref:Uncharacterized protein n=1 Tax=Cercophora newfieldiana TaxID=92897 RepID=A0AA39Y6Z9_9PEZI|nr:hypothetical protein B0T16DRAFT_457985 [Cercophora newfieldiana]
MHFTSCLFRALALVLAAANVNAQDNNQSISPTAETSPSTVESSSTVVTTPTAVTKVVHLFFIDERSYEGLPYTLLHRDSGSVANIDAGAGLTTFVVTSTRVDQRSLPTSAPTDNVTIGSVTLASTRQLGRANNTTGAPSTITQGPATFMFTGTRFGSDHTLVNRCSLNGTVSAVCNLTHVGSAWYTRNKAWNGTYSTYNYTWTSGDRFGFAPVTITAGAELLAAADPTASGQPNGATRGGGLGNAPEIGFAAVMVAVAVVLGAVVVL